MSLSASGFVPGYRDVIRPIEAFIARGEQVHIYKYTDSLSYIVFILFHYLHLRLPDYGILMTLYAGI